MIEIPETTTTATAVVADASPVEEGSKPERQRLCCNRTSSGGIVGSWCVQPLGHAAPCDPPPAEPPRGPVPSVELKFVPRADLYRIVMPTPPTAPTTATTTKGTK